MPGMAINGGDAAAEKKICTRDFPSPSKCSPLLTTDESVTQHAAVKTPDRNSKSSAIIVPLITLNNDCQTQ
jgi:hypothetical protein